MLTHVVLFWLKEGLPVAERDALLKDARQMLAQIPTVRRLEVGEPAGTQREVVDRSYDVGLMVLFDDLAGHDVYQDHPLHLEFIARNKPRWTQVKVFDFE